MKSLVPLLCVLIPSFLWAQPKKIVLTEAQRMAFDKVFFDGVREKLINNNREAEHAFEQALSIDKTNANAWFQLSTVLVLQKKNLQAENACSNAVALEPINKYYLIQLAGLYKLNGNYKEAALIQEKLVKLTGSVNDFFDLAETYYLAKNFKQSIKALNNAEKIAGPLENIYLQRKQIYLSVNQLKLALAEMDKLIKLYPSVLKYQGMKADILMANGKNKEAIKLYSQILLVDPNNGYAAFAMADYYRAMRDTLNWYSNLKKGITSDLTVREKMEVLMQVIPSKELPDHFNQCNYLVDLFIAQNSTDAAPYILKGDLFLAQKDFEAARKYYKTATNIDNRSILIWEQILFCNNQINSPQQMLNDCNEMLELYPDYLQAILFKALSLQQLKKYNEAVDACYIGLSLADNSETKVQFLSMLADAAHYQKNYQTADSAFAEVLKLEPENTYALNNWAYFLSLRNQNLDMADSMSLLTIKLEPENASYLDTYGWILYMKGNYEQALRYIQKSLDILPQNAEVSEHLGDVLFMLNKTDEAQQYWLKAKELGLNSETLLNKIKTRKLITKP